MNMKKKKASRKKFKKVTVFFTNYRWIHLQVLGLLVRGDRHQSQGMRMG